jgi:hypothetical protein
VSAAKLAANQSNAQQSTGPRTEEGKARSSRNALKHGLFSRTPGDAAPLSEEEQAALDALVLDGRQRYQPRGAEEEASADRIATLWWELQRTCAGRERYWRARVEAGDCAEEAVRACAALHARERQLERSIRHERQDLVFVQRLRNGELCKHRRAELQAHDRLMEMLATEQERANLRLMDLPRAPARETPPPAPRPPAPPIDPAIIPHAAKALALWAQAGLPMDGEVTLAPQAPAPRAPAPQAPAPQARQVRQAPHPVPAMERVPVRLPPFSGPSGNGRRPEVPIGSDD